MESDELIEIRVLAERYSWRRMKNWRRGEKVVAKCKKVPIESDESKLNKEGGWGDPQSSTSTGPPHSLAQ